MKCVAWGTGQNVCSLQAARFTEEEAGPDTFSFSPPISPITEEAFLGWDHRVLNLLTYVLFTQQCLWNVSVLLPLSLNHSFYPLCSCLFFTHYLSNVLFPFLHYYELCCNEHSWHISLGTCTIICLEVFTQKWNFWININKNLYCIHYRLKWIGRAQKKVTLFSYLPCTQPLCCPFKSILWTILDRLNEILGRF